MFGRIVITLLKSSLRSKKYIFWTLAFPIALGALFSFAFSSIYKSEINKPIPVVIEIDDKAVSEYRVMQSFANLDGDKLSDDLKKYEEDKAMAEAMGQKFDEKSPVSKEKLDNLESIESFDDLGKLSPEDLPLDYISIDPDEIDGEELPFIELMNDLTYDDGTKMIDRVETESHDAAEKMLEEGEIAAIITVSGLNDITMEENGYGASQSILSSIISQYRLQVGLTIDTINEDSEKLDQSEEMVDEAIEGIDYIDVRGTSGENKDPFVQYFYNLIAMVAIMGSMASMNVIVDCQANQRETGKRLDMAPVSKTFYELAALTAATLIQTAINIIALTFYIYVLGVNFGGSLGVIYLTTIIAGILGLSLGYTVAHIGRNADIKEGLLMTVILGGGFMSGLMYGDMKAIMEEHFPLFNRINPSAVITDAFYALNVFGVGERYYRALTYMVGLSVVFLIIGMLLSKKTSYKSL